MNLADKLFVKNLTYASLMKEFKQLKKHELKEICRTSSSFLDWLIDPSVNSLTTSKTQDFKKLLFGVITQKLELLLTAVGPLRIDEAPLRLFRSKRFVSVHFLKQLFLSEGSFEIVKKSGGEYVELSAYPSTEKKREETSNNRTASSLNDSNLKSPDDVKKRDCDSVRDKSAKDVCKSHPVANDHGSSEDPRSKQYRFLIQCQPDVVAALQPSVTLSMLFKAYTFWKSYCTHSHKSFIAWMLDIAEYGSKNNKGDLSLFEEYAAAVKKLIAEEAHNYVTAKSRTVKELTTLVSKAKSGFMDEDFLLEAVNENPSILRTDGANLVLSSSNLDYSKNNWADSSTTTSPQKSSLITVVSADPSNSHFVMSSLDESPAKKPTPNAGALSTVNFQHLTVIDSTYDLTWNLQDVHVPIEVRAKIVPLLTTNVSWESVKCTFNKIAKDQGEFLDEITQRFDCFMEFLVGFAESFKPSLSVEKYTDHLISILLNRVTGELATEQTIKLDKLVDVLTGKCSNCLSLASKSLILKMIARHSDLLQIVNNVISIATTRTIADMERVSIPQAEEHLAVNNLSEDAMSLENIKKLPEVNRLLSIRFKFEEFFETFFSFPKAAKELLKSSSYSFYALVMEVASAEVAVCETFRSHLRIIISAEIKNLFNQLKETSLAMLDVQLKLGRGDCSLVHCFDIRDAIENSFSEHLKITGPWIHLMEEKLSPSSKGFKPSPAELHHLSLKNNADDDITALSNEINKILSEKENEKSRLEKIFLHLKHAPESVVHYIKSSNRSLYSFTMEIISNKNELVKLLEIKLLRLLGGITLFCEELMAECFRFNPFFMTDGEFLDFLELCRHNFAVVGHHQIGNIVSAVRHADRNGKLLFMSRLEENAFFICSNVLASREYIAFNDLFDCLWESKKFSVEQRKFIMGLQKYDRPSAYNQLHVRRYLLMYPSVFFINGEMINVSELKKPLTLLKDTTILVISSGEEGELGFNNDLEAKPAKRAKLSKRLDAKKNERKQKLKVKKKKRKHRKNKDLTLHKTEDDSSTEKLKDLICSLPDHLIQDVALGRLVTTDDHVLKVTDVLEHLSTSLLREKRQAVDADQTIADLFKSKVMSVLTQGPRFHLSSESSVKGENRTLHLVVEKKPAPEPRLVVFRWVHRLTGVPTKKVTNYVKKVLKANGKSLSLSIIFTMICQKYGCKKAVAETPNEVLHCQTVACIKSDSKLFLNVVQRTCNLTKWTKEEDNGERLQEVCKTSLEDKIIVCLTKSLQATQHHGGLTIDDLVERVASNLGEESPSLPISALRVSIQGIVAENHNFGFTPLGTVVCQSVKTEPCLSEDSFDSSSEDDLKMDISDMSDEEKALPDSTNQDIIYTEEVVTEETYVADDLDKMCNNYIEADVIRCSYEKPVTDDVASADSTTVDGDEAAATIRCSSSSSALKDPRLKGKAFHNMIHGETLSGNKPSAKLPGAEVVAEKQENSDVGSKQMKPSKQDPNLIRRNMIEAFAIEFFTNSGYSCKTQAFVNAAYQQFKDERFAKSVLAFEAYVRDFVATSDDNLFSFGNPLGDIGVSYTFYRPIRSGVKHRKKAKMPFSDLLPQVFDIVYSYVHAENDKKAQLSAVCEHVAKHCSRRFAAIDSNEILHVCRNLILIACIRNLKWFFFGKVDQVVAIRQERDDRLSGKTSTFPEKHNTDVSNDRPSSSPAFYTPTSSTSSHPKPIIRNYSHSSTAKTTVSALQRMADILRIYGPCKKALLLELWSTSSDASHRKVFGTGVSFSLSLRKFEAYFPTRNDGLIHLDEVAFAKFLQENS